MKRGIFVCWLYDYNSGKYTELGRVLAINGPDAKLKAHRKWKRPIELLTARRHTRPELVPKAQP